MPFKYARGAAHDTLFCTRRFYFLELLLFRGITSCTSRIRVGGAKKRGTASAFVVLNKKVSFCYRNVASVEGTAAGDLVISKPAVTLAGRPSPILEVCLCCQCSEKHWALGIGAVRTLHS
jgi:hypothetical protein